MRKFQGIELIFIVRVGKKKIIQTDFFSPHAQYQRQTRPKGLDRAEPDLSIDESNFLRVVSSKFMIGPSKNPI
jgi:hypothetical protein